MIEYHSNLLIKATQITIFFLWFMAPFHQYITPASHSGFLCSAYKWQSLSSTSHIFHIFREGCLWWEHYNRRKTFAFDSVNKQKSKSKWPHSGTKTCRPPKAILRPQKIVQQPHERGEFFSLDMSSFLILSSKYSGTVEPVSITEGAVQYTLGHACREACSCLLLFTLLLFPAAPFFP